MTKLEILNLLSTARDLDAAGIAERLHGTAEAAGMMLVRLTRQGLVRREIDDRLFIYNLTRKGETRRVYLNTRERELTG
jgi:predicted ArsR family transcriptional regulator